MNIALGKVLLVFWCVWLTMPYGCAMPQREDVAQVPLPLKRIATDCGPCAVYVSAADNDTLWDVCDEATSSGVHSGQRGIPMSCDGVPEGCEPEELYGFAFTCCFF